MLYIKRKIQVEIKLFVVSKNKAKLLLVSSVFLFAIAVFIEFSSYENDYYNEKIKDLTLQYNNKISSNKNTATALLDHIIENKQVQNILYESSYNKAKNEDISRQKLFDTFKNEYKRMKDIGILQFHFHLKNGQSFLRFHKPKKYGDSLLFRKSIETIVKTKKEISGFEVGKFFEGFRYIYPIFKENIYVGSVEVAFSAKHIMQQLQKNIDGDFSIILKDKILSQNISKDHLQKYYHKLCVNENFYMINLLDGNNFSKESLLKISKQINSKIDKNNSFAISMHDKIDVVKIFTFIPFVGIDGKNVGFLFSVVNDSYIHNLVIYHILKFLAGTALLVLLYILFMKMKEKSSQMEQLQSAISKTTLISKSNEKGKITYVSDAFCEVSGYERNELIGKSHNIIRDPSMSKEAFKDMWKTIKEKKIWNGIVTNRKKDGSKYVVNATILPLLNQGGSIKEYIAIRHDITQLEEYKQRLKNKLDEYSTIVDKNVILSSTDVDGNIVFASEAFAKVSGYTKEELLGSNHSIIKSGKMDKKLYTKLWDTITSGKTWKGELQNKRKDGSYYWVDAVISPVIDEANNITGYTAVRQDITDKKIIEEISQKDKLTQIYNRLKLDEVLLSEMERNRRYKTQFSVILLDIDKFKLVNDNYGHPVGDSVLQQTAAILSKNIRKTDTLGRWGGEEFMIICANTNLDGALLLAEHLRKNMEQFEFDHVKTVTASFGVASYNSNELEEVLLKRCDDALYNAKRNGRNKVESIS